MMGFGDSGEPRVALGDSEGTMRVLLGVASHGTAVSALYDDDANLCIGMTVGPNGETNLTCKDANGEMAKTQTAK